VNMNLEDPRRFCVLAGVGVAFAVLATSASSAPCPNPLINGTNSLAICGSTALSAYAQYDDEDSDDDDDDEEDEDDEEDDEFVYDEDQGSLLVDQEDCEPGKYWMMDLEDGVMLPCR
jgi:hypothetical protein